MSKITVYQERIINEQNKIKYEYIPINGNNYACIQTDYLGNIYIKYKDIYYIVSLDISAESGIQLTQIIKPNCFRNNLLEIKNISENVRTGIINSGNQTLRGRVYETLNDMDDEEREDYMLKNDCSSYDPGFYERKYFWVQYQEEDEPIEGEIDDSFYMNGIVYNNKLNQESEQVSQINESISEELKIEELQIDNNTNIDDNIDLCDLNDELKDDVKCYMEEKKIIKNDISTANNKIKVKINENITSNNTINGIMYSDLLSLTPGTFDTILIEGDITSNRVVSSIERVDGHCSARLTLYTSGIFRANFIDISKFSKLCIDFESNQLITKLMN